MQLKKGIQLVFRVNTTEHSKAYGIMLYNAQLKLWKQMMPTWGFCSYTQNCLKQHSALQKSLVNLSY